MRKFIAAPGAEIIGSAMQNMFITVDHEEYLSFVEQMLAKYGIRQLEDDKWYPQQLPMDIFKLISQRETNSQHNLVGLGMAYVETGTFPPYINNIATGLNALSQTYYLNNRNGAEGEAALARLTHVQTAALIIGQANYASSIITSSAATDAPAAM